MTIVKHELRRSKLMLIIWTAAIGFMLAIAVLLYPQMKDEMQNASEMFADMGAMSDAFGMDKLDFGTFNGYYAIECGNVLGLGGAFFAALAAVAILAKEEKDHTAEFLLTHPLKRRRIVSEKLAAIAVQLVAMNAAICALSIVSILAIGEEVPWKEFWLLHGAYFIMQVELAGICFGISAFVRKGGIAIGLGVAVLAYFLNIIANLTESAKFLKYVTPFGYCEGADIVADGALDAAKIAIGLALCVGGIAAAFVKYEKKDIR